MYTQNHVQTVDKSIHTFLIRGPSWSWSYGSWIYNYLCNQCLSPLTLWVRIPLRWGVFDTTLCDKVCQWFATGQQLSPGTPVSSIHKTDCHDITEILLNVSLNTITLTHVHSKSCTDSGQKYSHTSNFNLQANLL
jgi:hypothetical protein